MQLRIVFLIGISIGLTSCMVGPNFYSPAPPQVCRYTECPDAKKTIAIPQAGNPGKAQYFLLCRSIPLEWWRLFHSPEINCLICAGLANNQNLAAAKASLWQAQENFIAQVGTLYPTVTGNFSAERQRFSASTFGGTGAGPLSNIFNLVNTNVSVAYTLDIFGGLRRQVEAAGAQVDFQQYELNAAWLTLSSNIVTTAITIASLRAQIDATYELIRSQAKTVDIVRKQFNLGGAALTDVLNQETQLNQLKSTLPPLQQSLFQNLHAMSVLVGNMPCAGGIPQINLTKLHLPRKIPIGVPSLLVRHRPDVQAAEALLHAASAQIGVATANLFPQLTLTGNYGWENAAFGGLFAPENKVWSVAAALAQPIFSGGSLLAKRRASFAGFAEACAQYRQTVLQAFQNVADALRALQQDAKLLKAQKEREISAAHALALTKQQLFLGGVNYLNLLVVERAYQQAHIARIQAQAARYTDTAALFQALGGGWDSTCIEE